MTMQIGRSRFIYARANTWAQPKSTTIISISFYKMHSVWFDGKLIHQATGNAGSFILYICEESTFVCCTHLYANKDKDKDFKIKLNILNSSTENALSLVVIVIIVIMHFFFLILRCCYCCRIKWIELNRWIVTTSSDTTTFDRVIKSNASVFI